MKRAALVLSLGCTAVLYRDAVRPELFLIQPSKVIGTPLTATAFEDHWRFFPRFPGVPEPPRQDNAPSAPEIPMVSKAEALRLIAISAARYHVPAPFVTSIVAAESNFNCHARSPKGAIGLMQLMPETAQQFGADPAVPAENVDAGTHYLSWLIERYRNRRGSMKRVIAAYNAGPGAVDRYSGVPPFRETRNYVAVVLGFLKHFTREARQRGMAIEEESLLRMPDAARGSL